MTVIPFHERMKKIADAHPYELIWAKGLEVCQVSCSNKEQILRQMQSLAERKVAAAVYKNGQPAGWVVPGPAARSGGPYQAFFMEPQSQH